MFDEIVAYDVLEHLRELLNVFEELHRIGRKAGVLKITVPHFSCSNAFTDPTHCHYFGQKSFLYFTNESRFSFYTKSKFKLKTCRIIFEPTVINKVVHRFANKWPSYYEERWAWIFPAWFIYTEHEIIK